MTERRAAEATTVLVIAAEPEIEALLGELVVFAGHRPVFDTTAGAAGEAVRRIRPAIAIIDGDLGEAVTRACVTASAEADAIPILVSSTASERELAALAACQQCASYPLPGSPVALRRLMERLLDDQPRSVPAVPPEFRALAPSTASHSAVHPAICAAIMSIAHAEIVNRRARSAVHATRLLRAEMRKSLAQARQERDRLRAAIADYAGQLRTDNIPRETAVELVRVTLADCATRIGASAALDYLMDETRHWALEAYDAG